MPFNVKAFIKQVNQQVASTQAPAPNPEPAPAPPQPPAPPPPPPIQEPTQEIEIPMYVVESDDETEHPSNVVVIRRTKETEIKRKVPLNPLS